MNRRACRSIVAAVLAEDLCAGHIGSTGVDWVVDACQAREFGERAVRLVTHRVRVEIAHRRLTQSARALGYMYER